MKSAFPGHFANDPDDLKALWEDSLIVVDANVLLSLYRYSDNTRNEFLDVFGKLKDRLWIPHQVAKEYLKNRISVISDQAKSYAEAIKHIEDLRKGLESTKQHPFISSALLTESFACFDRITAELQQSKDQHDNKINNDELKNAIGDIFEGKVGDGYLDVRLEQAIVDGKARYDNNIPPGFKDAKKGGGNSFEERLAPYGDYICWLQILDKSISDGCNVIYVTGDLKEDWWLRPNGKTVGPLPELIEEFVRKTSRKFYMYMPDRFLQRAGDYLKQAVSPEAMKEARDVQWETVEIHPKAMSDLQNFITHTWQDHQDLRHKFKAEDFLLSNRPSRWKFKYPPRYPKDLMAEVMILEYELKELSSELNRRLVEGPSKKFESLSDSEIASRIERLTDQVKLAAFLAQQNSEDEDEDEVRG